MGGVRTNTDPPLCSVVKFPSPSKIDTVYCVWRAAARFCSAEHNINRRPGRLAIGCVHSYPDPPPPLRYDDVQESIACGCRLHRPVKSGGRGPFKEGCHYGMERAQRRKRRKKHGDTKTLRESRCSKTSPQTCLGNFRNLPQCTCARVVIIQILQSILPVRTHARTPFYRL